jgi:hypothetical protein
MVTPHQGSAALVEIPMVSVAEIEATVTVLRDGLTSAAPGIVVLLLDGVGKEAARTVSEYDGFYLFEGVRPGTYTVRLDDGQLESLGFAPLAAIGVVVKSNGTTANKPNFCLLPKPGTMPHSTP